MSAVPRTPIGIVSGSGIDLAPMLDHVDDKIPFADVPGLCTGGVPGHDHQFIRGSCNGIPIVLQCGRLHLYEGYEYDTIVKPVDVMHDWGVRAIIFTAAAGGLVVGMAPGDLVAIERVRMWRYLKWPATPGMAYTDFLVPNCAFTGTYQWMPGPAYETRAEIAALQQMRMAAVGMSTAPELLRAQDLKMRAAMIACITNSCCAPQILSHDHVCAIAKKNSYKIVFLLQKALPGIE